MMGLLVGLVATLIVVVAIALWLIFKPVLREDLEQQKDLLEEESTGIIPSSDPK